MLTHGEMVSDQSAAGEPGGDLFPGHIDRRGPFFMDIAQLLPLAVKTQRAVLAFVIGAVPKLIGKH